MADHVDEVDMTNRALVCYIFHVVAAVVFAMGAIWFSLLAKGLVGEMNNGQHHYTAVLQTIYIGVLVLLIVIATLCGLAAMGFCASFIIVLIISVRSNE